MKTDWNNWANVQRLYKQLYHGAIKDIADNLGMNHGTVSEVLRLNRPHRRVDVIAIYEEAVRLLAERDNYFE